MRSSSDNEYPYIGNNLATDLDTATMQDELIKLQRKYNNEKVKLIELNDEKSTQFTDLTNNNEPSTNIPQTISMEVNPPISNIYQNSIYGPSPVPESESCEIDNSLYSFTPSITPSCSPLPKSSHQLIIPNDYKQSFNSLQKQKQKQTVYKFKPMPNKPIPPTPTKQRERDNSAPIITDSNTVKWVNFIARVKCHQSKQIYKTFNYHRNEYKENINTIINKLDLTDKNIENGSIIIDGYKLFVFVRNLNCRFPYEMLLRTNNDNHYNSMQFLNKIVNETKYSIDQMNIYDIATFDYNLHFDNIINKLIALPKYNPTFYIQNQ